jgi:transcriptional regulator with XRE-family HTH domain
VIVLDVGARIRELRKARGLTSRQLAEITNISQPVISRLESNTRSADVSYIEIICNALGISLADFFAADQSNMDPELQQLLETAKKLTPAQRESVRKMLETMNKG